MMRLRIKQVSVMNPFPCFLRFPCQSDNPLHTGINVSLQQPPFLHCPLYVRIKHSIAAWHFQVAARLKRPNPVIHCAPVCHNQSLKAPLITQNICQKGFVVTRKGSVYLVVGAHHGIRLALFHCHLKGRQIDFAQCTLVHHTVPHHAVLFLIICRIML